MLGWPMLFLIIVPTAFARCVDKYYRAPDCVQRCQSKMGYPGMTMGSGRWGTVLVQSDPAQWTALLSQACGLSGTPSGAKVANAPEADPSSVLSTSATSSSSVSSGSSTASISGTNSQSTQSISGTISSESKLPAVTTSAKIPTTSTTQRSGPITTIHSPDPTTTTSPRTTSSSHTSSNPPKSTQTGSTSTDGTSSTIQAFLAGHNTIRSQHGAKDLTWSEDLAASAQAWANNCVFKHSRSGENLAAGVGGGYNIPAAIKSWTDEVKSYNPNNPEPSHFTQVVWKATTQVGCATQMCNGIFDDSFGKALYVVCHYSPAGNVDGQYSQNVQV